MDRRLFFVALLAACLLVAARGDYLSVVSWQSSVVTTCASLASSASATLYNLNTTSNFSACVYLLSGQYGQFYCWTNGTANVTLSPNTDCSPQTGAPGNLAVKPVAYDTPACWGPSELPTFSVAAYLQITCYAGSIPVPAAPSPPVAPTPTSTPTAAPIAPTAAPTSTPHAPTASSPVSSPSGSAPSSAPVVSSPVAAPVAAPNAGMAIVGANMWFTACTGTNCTNPTVSTNMTADINACQPYGSDWYMVDCSTTVGLPYGMKCYDSGCMTCDAWPIVQNPPYSWNIPRCVNTTAVGGLSATCSPIYAYQVPIAPPTVPITPPTAPTAPTAPSTPVAPTPVTPVVTVDYAAQFGTSCNSPAIFGSFANSTSCQTVYSGSAYAVAYCTSSGAPMGKVCTVSSCSSPSGCTSFSGTGTVWGQSICITTSQNIALSLTCDNHTIPAPPPAPVAPQAPVPPPVSSGGQITFTAYIDNKCRTAATELLLVANISLCQKASAAGQTIYMKADCYSSGIIHGAICGQDPTCTSCNALPPAPSGLCVPYAGFNFVNGIMVTCPVVPPPSTPARTSSASKLASGLLSIIMVIALLALSFF